MNSFNIFIKLEFYKNRQLVFYTPAFLKIALGARVIGHLPCI